MLGIIIRIVKMNNAFFMCFDNISRKQKSSGKISADLSCHIITLHTVNSRILVGILLLYFLIIALDQAHDLLICGIGLTHKCMLISVCDIFSGNLVFTGFHQSVFYQILNLLHTGSTCQILTVSFYFQLKTANLFLRKALILCHFLIGFRNRSEDLLSVENCFLTASFNDFHR